MEPHWLTRNGRTNCRAKTKDQEIISSWNRKISHSNNTKMVGRQSGTFCAWNGLRLDCIFSGCAYNKDGQNVQTYELQPKGGRSTGQLDGIIIMLRFLVPSSFYLSFAIATAVSHGTSYPAHNLPHSICKSAGGGFFPGPNLLSKRHWWKKKKRLFPFSYRVTSHLSTRKRLVAIVSFCLDSVAVNGPKFFHCIWILSLESFD